MRRALHLRTNWFLRALLASFVIATAASTPRIVAAQSSDPADAPPTPLEAMFLACLAPNVPMALRSKTVLESGWQAAESAPSARSIVEQLAVRADRGDPPKSWDMVLADAAGQVATLGPETQLFSIGGDVPSLLIMQPTPGGMTCGYSASDSSREALQLLLGVGKDPSEQAAGTLTIRAAVSVRAIVQDDQSRDWQVEAASHFADPAEITAETGQPFSTAFALTIALEPAES